MPASKTTQIDRVPPLISLSLRFVCDNWPSLLQKNPENSRKLSEVVKQSKIPQQNWFNFVTGLGQLTDQLAQFFVPNNVTRIDISSNEKVTDFTIMTIANKALTSLTVFKMAHCPYVTLTGFQFIATSCPSLHTLSLSHCTANVTDDWLALIGKTYTATLTFLDIAACKQVTDAGFTQLATCTKLRTLHASRCRLLTNLSVKAIPSSFPNLEVLHLGWMMPSISSKYLRYCTHLTTLVIAECDKLTDSTLVRILQANLESLVSLDVSWCVNLFNKAHDSIDFMGNLHSIKMGGVGIGPEHINKLAQSCHKLEKIDISWNKRVETENVLAIICSNKATLRRVDVSQCKMISKASWEEFRKEGGEDLDIVIG